MIKLDSKEIHVLQKCMHLNLSLYITKINDMTYILHTADLDELYDKLNDYVMMYGLNDNSSLTAEGKIAESLSDRIYDFMERNK